MSSVKIENQSEQYVRSSYGSAPHRASNFLFPVILQPISRPLFSDITGLARSTKRVASLVMFVILH